MLRKLVIGGLFLTAASPALAGWQKTTWGMTPAQVVAATAGAAKLDSGEPGERVTDGSEAVRVVGSYSSGKWQFRSVFYFVSDKLAEVRLKLLNGEQGCGSLWADVSGLYGKPFKENRDLVNYSIWHDTKKNNQVTLMEIGDSCSLSYKPLKSEDNAGL